MGLKSQSNLLIDTDPLNVVTFSGIANTADKHGRAT
jgi:hypothetical protein